MFSEPKGYVSDSLYPATLPCWFRLLRNPCLPLLLPLLCYLHSPLSLNTPSRSLTSLRQGLAREELENLGE